MPRALTQGGDRLGGGHPRRNKDGDGRTSVHNALAVIRTATQLAQRRRLSPEPQVPRALIWRGRDGSPQVPGGRTQQARVPDNWQHTATPRNTPRRQPIPLPAPNIIKQDPVVFHKSSVGLNEGGQRLSATPLTSPTEPSPGLDIFPWMENIPERLVQRLRWTQGTSPKVPSSGPIIVLLYAGKEDPTSLDSCLHANYPHLSSMVVAVDILRSGPKGNHDMLQPELYGAVCTAAKQGRVVFIGGGPNCRTWSILRHIPKPATPVRGRTPETLWGLPHLDQAAQTQLADDSILILRQMYITSLARASRAAVSLPGPRSFLEHPEDPVVSSSLPKAKECSSFWITEEGQLWMEENSLTAISFDQCRLGQLVKKATTLATISRSRLGIKCGARISHMWAPTSPRLLADTLGI